MKGILLSIIYISNFFYNECGCLRKKSCKGDTGKQNEDTGMIEKKELGIKLNNVKVKYVIRKNFKFENGNEIFKKLLKNVKDNGSEIILDNNENVNHITEEKYNKFIEYYKIKENRNSLTATEKNFLEKYLDKKVESNIKKKIQEESKKKKEQENLLHENKKEDLNSLKKSISELKDGFSEKDIDGYREKLNDIIKDYNPNEDNKKLIDKICKEIAKKKAKIIEDQLKSEEDEKNKKNIIVNVLNNLINKSKNKTYLELSNELESLEDNKFKNDADVKKLINDITKKINIKKKEEEKQQIKKECTDKLDNITNMKIYENIITNEKFSKKISDIRQKINSISDEKSKNEIINSIKQLEDELKNELQNKSKEDEEIIEEETVILPSVESDVIFNTYEKIKKQFEEIFEKQEYKELKDKTLEELEIIKKDLDNINAKNKDFDKITEKDTDNILYVLGFKAFKGNKVDEIKKSLFDFEKGNDCFQTKNLKEIGSENIDVKPSASKKGEKEPIATITCSKTTALFFTSDLTNNFYEYDTKGDGFKMHVDSDAKGNDLTPDVYTDIIYRCYCYNNCTYLFILNTLHYTLKTISKLYDCASSWFNRKEEKTGPTNGKGDIVKTMKSENDTAVRKIINFIKSKYND